MTHDGWLRKPLLTTGGYRPSHSKPNGGFGESETIERDHINYIYLGVHRALGRVVFWVDYVGTSRGDQRLVSIGAQVIGLHVVQDAFGGRRWRQINDLQILRTGGLSMHTGSAGNV
jgi:hypothetical protein